MYVYNENYMLIITPFEYNQMIFFMDFSNFVYILILFR